MIIGKEGEQKEPITDQYVSRKHCRITELGNGKYLLEDLDSKNGTFVNGQRVGNIEIDGCTIVQLGPKYQFRVKNMFVDIHREFLKLEQVYNKYNEDKIKAGQDIAKKQFQRSLIPSLITPLMFTSSLFMQGENMMFFRVIAVVLMLISMTYTTILARKAMVENPQKSLETELDFKKHYVCPSCGRFLGNITFEELKNSVKKCPYCKTKWCN